MKQDYSSKEEIFTKAKEIVYRDGLQSLSMRKLANECFLALGTLYHYYDSKEDLVVLIMEDFWKESFNGFFVETESLDFIGTFERFYDLSLNSFKKFDRAFAKQRIGAKTLLIKGKEREEMFINMLIEHLKKAAINDEKVNLEVFDDDFTLNEFITTIVRIMILSFLNHDGKKKFLSALITKTMY